MPAATPEDDLIEKTARGDRAAFTDLVDRTRDDLFRYVRSLVQSDQLAEDALQEVYVGVWRGANTFEGNSSARVWLFSLARRQAARTWRRRVGEPKDPLGTDALALATDAGFGEAFVARRTLSQGLAKLDEWDREVLVLRDVMGFSGSEAALLVGIDIAALKSRLHRARLRLMAILREGEEDGNGH